MADERSQRKADGIVGQLDNQTGPENAPLSLARKDGEPKVSKQVVPSAAFSGWVLNVGFIVALVLASVCLVTSGYYLIQFQSGTQNAILNVLNNTVRPQPGLYELSISGQMYLARVLLLSCGIATGMAFGFLGFALFLIGVKEPMGAEGSQQDKISIKLERVAPGVFVIVCAMVLIAVCATRSLPYDYDKSPVPLRGDQANGQAGAVSGSGSSAAPDSTESQANKRP